MRFVRSGVLLLALDLALPLGIFLAAEGAFRVYRTHAADPPVPRLFPQPVTTAKYLAYRALANEGAPLDVLLFGLSQMQRVNARQVEEGVEATGYPPISVFNFGGPFQSVIFTEHLLHEILLKLSRPLVIVYGFLPISLIYESERTATDSLVRGLPVFAAYAGTPGSLLNRALLHTSDLLLYREVIRDRLLLRPPVENSSALQMARDTDRLGDVRWPVADRRVRGLTSLEQDYAKRFKKFDDMMLTNPLFDDLAHFAAFCKAEGIRLVVVNNTVHPLFMQMLPRGEEDYRRFTDRLRLVASQEGALFFDPAGDGIGRPAFFYDTHHHSNAGTQWLGKQLGRFLVDSGVLDEDTPQ